MTLILKLLDKVVGVLVTCIVLFVWWSPGIFLGWSLANLNFDWLGVYVLGGASGVLTSFAVNRRLLKQVNSQQDIIENQRELITDLLTKEEKSEFTRNFEELGRSSN